MKLKNFIIGNVVVLLLFVAMVVLGGIPIVIYVDIPSFILIVGFPLIVTLYSHGKVKMGQCFSLIFGQQSGTKEEYLRANVIVKMMGKALTYTTILGSGIGFIGIMLHLDDVKNIGPNFAILCLVLLYSSYLQLTFITPASSVLSEKAIQ